MRVIIQHRISTAAWPAAKKRTCLPSVTGKKQSTLEKIGLHDVERFFPDSPTLGSFKTREPTPGPEALSPFSAVLNLTVTHSHALSK